MALVACDFWVSSESACGCRPRGAEGPPRWFINDKFTPDSTTCIASIETEDGAVPTGKAAWQSFADDRPTLEIAIAELTVDRCVLVGTAAPRWLWYSSDRVTVSACRVPKAQEVREARHKAVKIRLAKAKKAKEAEEAAK